MTTHDDDSGKGASAKLSAAADQARQAINSAKDYVAGADLDQLRSKAADAAGSLYQGGRDLLTNTDELAKAKDQITESIRKNPLAAIGIAFTAGLVLALLTRG